MTWLLPAGALLSQWSLQSQSQSQCLCVCVCLMRLLHCSAQQLALQNTAVVSDGAGELSTRLSCSVKPNCSGTVGAVNIGY